MYWKTVGLLGGCLEKKWYEEGELTFCHSLKDKKRQKYFPTHTFSVYKDFQKNRFSENMPC